jgi:hypothetical protein
MEGLRGENGGAQMSAVRRIEGAAKESYPHAGNAITVVAIAYQILRTRPVVRVFALTDWLGTAL